MENTIRALIVEKGKNIIPRLEEIGGAFSYARAHDAASAKLKLETGEYHLVVLDSEMPELDGPSLVQDIRRGNFPGGVCIGDHYDGVYIIVINCSDNESVLNSYLDAGADDVLARSVDPWNMKKSIRMAHRILTLNRLLSRTFSRMAETQQAAAIGRLVPGIAHEINNPLGFVDGNLSVLTDYCRRMSEEVKQGRTKIRVDERSETFPPGELHETSTEVDAALSDLFPLLDETRDGVERMKKLLRDIQQVSLSDGGHPTDIDINNCLDAVLNVLRNELKYKAKVNTSFDRIPLVQARPAQMHQLFLNLLSLVASAMGERGEINIATSHGDGQVAVIIDAGGYFTAGRTPSGDDEAAFVAVNIRGETESELELLVAQTIIQRHNGALEGIKGGRNGAVFRVRLPMS